jgi:hypothetical protein
MDVLSGSTPRQPPELLQGGVPPKKKGLSRKAKSFNLVGDASFELATPAV